VEDKRLLRIPKVLKTTHGLIVIVLIICLGLSLNFSVKGLNFEEVIQQSPAFHTIHDIYVVINNQYHSLSEWISFEETKLKIFKEVDVNGSRITGLAAPSHPKDAVNLETLEQALSSVSGWQAGSCPLFPGTFFINGGNPYFCKKMSVSANGYVSYTNINEDKKCDVGKTCCQGECDTDKDMDGYSLNCDGDCDDSNVNIGVSADGTCDGDGDGFIDEKAGLDLSCKMRAEYNLDADDTNPSVGPISPNNVNGKPADGTCDGDYDGFIDYTAGNGNFIGLDCDDNNPNIGNNCSIVFVTNGTHTGDFLNDNSLEYVEGGYDCSSFSKREEKARCHLDNFCVKYKPKDLVCNNIHALISVWRNDEIRDMPSKYGYDENGVLYWYNPYTKRLTILAYNWTDMLDGSILNSQVEGTGVNVLVWTGSTAEGALSEGCTPSGIHCCGFPDWGKPARQNCYEWSSSSGICNCLNPSTGCGCGGYPDKKDSEWITKDCIYGPGDFECDNHLALRCVCTP